MLPGQRPEDRPDLVALIFKLHLKGIICDINEKHVLSNVIAHVYVIEFFKNVALSHCHMLIILSNDSKLRDSNDIDTIIYADIPDQATGPELFDIIKSSMVHGPCGALNKDSVCMADDKCTKDCPKDFREDTSLV